MVLVNFLRAFHVNIIGSGAGAKVELSYKQELELEQELGNLLLEAAGPAGAEVSVVCSLVASVHTKPTPCTYRRLSARRAHTPLCAHVPYVSPVHKTVSTSP